MHAPDDPDPPPAPRAGTVTALVAQKKNRHRVSVFLDGDFAFGLARNLAAEQGLHKGLFLSVERQQALRRADELLAAKTTALNYLRRRRTVHETRQALARRDFDDAVIEQVIARFMELGYLDDATYAHDYVKARFANRGYGPRRLRNDMMRRGLAPPLIEEALETLGDDDLMDEARRHAERKWAGLRNETDPRKRRKKLSDYLVRRGYSYDTVFTLIDELERADPGPGDAA